MLNVLNCVQKMLETIAQCCQRLISIARFLANMIMPFLLLLTNVEQNRLD